MPWRYVIHSGQLLAPDGSLAGVGYAGHGAGLNNVAMQDAVGVGPLPSGRYTIGSPHTPVDHLGPLAMPLIPARTNEMHGRSGFFIHGDNAKMNHTASNGCIIAARVIRQKIADSHDRVLDVSP